jgi:hypothetical protein
MAHFEDAVRFGGTVLAHAAWIASDLEDGALVCPFAIIQTGGEREVIAFESDSQAESIELGKASFQDYKERVEFWSFAREGLLSYVGSDGPKVDVLTVSVWGQGLDEPLMLRQRFNSNAKGGFKLVGPIEVAIHGLIPPEPTSSALRLTALQGVEQHPHGELWAMWTSP